MNSLYQGQAVTRFYYDEVLRNLSGGALALVIHDFYKYDSCSLTPIFA